MEDLITHLLKSAGLISLFFVCYFFLLKNDTSFKTNRLFLIAGILTSIFLPFLKITRVIEVENTAVPFSLKNLSAIPQSPLGNEGYNIDWWQIAGLIYLVGLGFFLLKFFIELFSLLKLIYTNKASREDNFYVIRKSGNIQPFSFFKYIVLNPDLHPPAEQELILRHERSHARQWHSIDQLLTSLSTYLLWFNPLTWLYRKSVVQNLEYLADREVIDGQVSKIAYQKTLLKISVGDFQPAFTNQFYQSFIKKRIMMLNENSSQKSNLWKTGLILPLLLIFIFSINVETVAQVVGQDVETRDPVTSEVEIAVTVSRNSTPESLSQFEKIFLKRGVALEFENPEYSNEGLLTGVQVSFERMENKKTGSISLHDPKGIEPTTIYTNERETGFRIIKSEGTPGEVMAGPGLSALGKEPLYIIGNKEYDAAKLYGKHIHLKEGMRILSPKEAEEQFGKKAADGAVIITRGDIISDFGAALKKIDSDNKSVKRNYLQIEKNRYPAFISLENYHEAKQENDSKDKFNDVPYHRKANDIIAVQQDNQATTVILQETDPLIVVDGKVQEKDFQVSGINPETIESINVLKGEDAIEKYGKQGKNGVIEINLKTNSDIKGSGTTSKAEGKAFTITVGSSHFDDTKSKRLSVRDVGSAQSLPPDVLYVLNGKIMEKDFDVNSISVDNIESITVLKDDKAIQKYGEKASKGVIEITTRE